MISRALQLIVGAAAIVLVGMWCVDFASDRSPASRSKDLGDNDSSDLVRNEANADAPEHLSTPKRPLTESLTTTQHRSTESEDQTSFSVSASSETHVAEPNEQTQNSGDLHAEWSVPVGAPFPVSPSVTHSCNRISGLGQASCADIYAILERMQDEPRDETWAEAMEELIKGLVYSTPGYAIRSLGCRTTVCAFEVESTQGVFRPNKLPLKGKLAWVDQNYGYEGNGSTLVKVTLVALQRD